MGFEDILKKSFLEGFASTEIGTKETIIALLVTLALAAYIFFCYRLMTRRTFYSKNFNLSLVVVSLITAAIILTIQTSVVVSLGMVGALSIVRFRTAIKEPIDLAFLFWSISVGIICGAGHAEIAVVLSLVITLAIFVFERIPLARVSKILVMNTDSSHAVNADIDAVLKKYCRSYTEKSRTIKNGRADVVYELRVEDGTGLAEELSALQPVHSVSLLKHDGEVTF